MRGDGRFSQTWSHMHVSYMTDSVYEYYMHLPVTFNKYSTLMQYVLLKAMPPVCMKYTA